MLKIVNISKKIDKEMGEIIRDCLEEYGLNKAGTAWEDPYLDKFSEYYKDIKGEYFVALLEETGAKSAEQWPEHHFLDAILMIVTLPGR